MRPTPPDDAPLLPYASADPAALRPGESLLWEGGALAARRWWRRQPPPAGFRITDRRAFCITPRPRPAEHRAAVPLPVGRGFVVHDRRRGGSWIELGHTLWLTRLDDWRPAAMHLASVARRPGRRARRRSPTRSSPTVPIEPTSRPSFDPSDLSLLPDERVLWAGRPRPRSAFGWPAIRHKLGLLGWGLVPGGMLLWAASVDSGRAEPAPVIVGVIAGLWLIVLGYGLTVGPLRRRWRLGRSRYVLTTRRAFAIGPDRGGGRRISFVFLDALPATFARAHEPDGFGDVPVDAVIRFERVPDPAAVHAALVDAVIAARRDLPDLGWGTNVVAPAMDE